MYHITSRRLVLVNQSANLKKDTYFYLKCQVRKKSDKTTNSEFEDKLLIDSKKLLMVSLFSCFRWNYRNILLKLTNNTALKMEKFDKWAGRSDIRYKWGKMPHEVINFDEEEKFAFGFVIRVFDILSSRNDTYFHKVIVGNEIP